MQAALPLLLGLFALASCAPTGAPSQVPAADVQIRLSDSQKVAIGQKIWSNECGGTVDGLTTWNAGEEFPSLGIGHFIWYPKGFNGPFKESWPEFVAYARQQGAEVPSVALKADSPWNSKAEFLRDFRGQEMSALRRWLVTSVRLQTDFIISRSAASLPKMLDAAPASERARIAENYQKVASTPQGMYALIDYVNFKGDGTVVTERYNGQGWGLLQVLGHMRDVPSGPAAATEFSNSSIRMLERRVSNSPPDRGEKRWMPGWRNRCLTYARGL